MSLLENLKKYFKNTPRNKVLSDWNETIEETKHIESPTITEFTDNLIKKRNPYNLIWYKKGWSDKKISENNKKYWDFEIKHNGFKP